MDNVGSNNPTPKPHAPLPAEGEAAPPIRLEPAPAAGAPSVSRAPLNLGSGAGAAAPPAPAAAPRAPVLQAGASQTGGGRRRRPDHHLQNLLYQAASRSPAFPGRTDQRLAQRQSWCRNQRTRCGHRRYHGEEGRAQPHYCGLVLILQIDNGSLSAYIHLLTLAQRLARTISRGSLDFRSGNSSVRQEPRGFSVPLSRRNLFWAKSTIKIILTGSAGLANLL